MGKGSNSKKSLSKKSKKNGKTGKIQQVIGKVGHQVSDTFSKASKSVLKLATTLPLPALIAIISGVVVVGIVTAVVVVNSNKKKDEDAKKTQAPVTEPPGPPAPIKNVCTAESCTYTPAPITESSNLSYFDLACSNHKTQGSCEADRCKWWNNRCHELMCNSSVRWKFDGSTVQQNVTIKDFTYDVQNCPELPFANVTATDFAGQVVNPVNFDANLTPADRLAWAAKEVTYENLDTVDVDDLTDDQIRSRCLTMEDCINPPILTVIRVKDTKQPWRPNPNSYKNPIVDRYCCDYKPGGDYRTLKFLPPQVSGNRFQNPVDIIGTKYYPRLTNGQPTTQEQAKIIRVEFRMRGEPTVLYAYGDNTCGTTAGFFRRSGFMGQQMARMNGTFPEIMYRSPDPMPNTHGTLKVKGIGFTSNAADFGGTGNLNPFFSCQGHKRAGQTNYDWVTWWQMWMFAPTFSRPQMVAAYLQVAMEWAYNSLPRGNIAVVTCYLRAAQVQYIKAGISTGVDFSGVAKYSREYEQLRPSTEYLAEFEGNQPRFMSLNIEACTAKWPDTYYQKLKNWLAGNLAQPPEAWIEKGFCDVACQPYWTVVETARALTYDQVVSEVPKCSRCPGLVGIFRENVSSTGKTFQDFPWQPQCLPFLAPTGTLITDPRDLVTWKDQSDVFCTNDLKPLTVGPTVTPGPTADPSSYTTAPDETEGPTLIEERSSGLERFVDETFS